MARTKGQRAQTAVELAVFGAILIFALGAIIRGGVSRGNQQNSIYKATRLALTMSYDTSADMTTSARNTASVLVVEDRLTAGSSKYGPIDRAPSIMQGSGAHSSNLFMPVDFGDAEDLPLFDLFVNGQHIDLSTQAFKTIEIVPQFPDGGTGGCGTQCESRIWIDSPNMDNVDRTTLPPAGVGGTYKSVCLPCPETVQFCVGNITVGRCARSIPDQCAAGICSDCSVTSRETYQVENLEPPQSCAKLYAVAYNHPSDTKWCTGGSIPCPPECPNDGTPARGCNLPPEERFDLDRADLDKNGTDSTVGSGEWGRFSWQWYEVNGFEESDSVNDASNLTAPSGTAVTYNVILEGEGIKLPDNDDSESQNLDVDVDEDLLTERIEGIYQQGNIIIGLDVRDSQDGDIDFTFSPDRSPNEIPPGFTEDVNVYTEVRDTGTYLKIEQGQLVDSGGQAIRTASKKDTVDLIERVFKLSNDTHRLCDGGSPVTRPDGTKRVEACGSCFSGSRIEATCFDPSSLLLFVRSRISGYQGHKWTTDRSTDPNVDFTTPGL